MKKLIVTIIVAAIATAMMLINNAYIMLAGCMVMLGCIMYCVKQISK